MKKATKKLIKALALAGVGIALMIFAVFVAILNSIENIILYYVVQIILLVVCIFGVFLFLAGLTYVKRRIAKKLRRRK